MEVFISRADCRIASLSSSEFGGEAVHQHGCGLYNHESNYSTFLTAQELRDILEDVKQQVKNMPSACLHST